MRRFGAVLAGMGVVFGCSSSARDAGQQTATGVDGGSDAASSATGGARAGDGGARSQGGRAAAGGHGGSGGFGQSAGGSPPARDASSGGSPPARDASSGGSPSAGGASSGGSPSAGGASSGGSPAGDASTGDGRRDASSSAGGSTSRDAASAEAGGQTAGRDGGPSAVDASAFDGTIYAIQRPSSQVAPGTHVVIDDSAIQVTGVSTDVFFMQEAGPRYPCVQPTSPVEYRGITVEPLAFDATLPIGQRVRVEGDVAEIAGNTTIIDAVVTRIGAPAAPPYGEHCFRSGAKLLQEAYEGILVRIDGTTVEPASSALGLPWQVAPCLDAPLVTIGNSMYALFDWKGSQSLITGVLLQEGAEYRVEPRRDSDVYQDDASDTCL